MPRLSLVCRWWMLVLLGLSCLGIARAQPDPWQNMLDGGRIAVLEQQYPEARRLYALALAEVEVDATEDARVEDALSAMVALYRVWPQGGGEVYFRDLLARWERQYGTDDPRVAAAAEALADYLRREPEDAGDDARLAPLYTRALAIRTKVYGAADPRLAHTLARLARLAALAGRTPDAESGYQRAISLKEKAGQRDDELARLEAAFATFRWEQRQYDEAGSCWQRALAIDEQIHPDSLQLATTLRQLGWAEERLGHYSEMTTHWQRAAELRGRLDAGGWELPQLLDNLAPAYHLLGNDADAEQVYRWELTLRERINKSMLEPTEVALADIYLREERFSEAQTLYQRCGVTRKQPTFAQAQALAGQAECALARGELLPAIFLQQRARAMLEQTPPPAEIDQVAMDARLSLALRDYARVEADCAKSMRDDGYPATHPRKAECLSLLAKVKLAWGTPEEAEATYARALATWEACLGTEHPALVAVLLDGAELYRALGKADNAEAQYTRAAAIAQRVVTTTEDGGIDTLLRLARYAQRMGKIDVAESYCEQAVTCAERDFGAHDLRLAAVFRQTAHIWQALRQPARAQTQITRAREIETNPTAQ